MKPILQPELRLRWLWVPLGVVLLAGIVFYCLVPSADVPNLVGSDKLKHFVAFGALAFWFGSIVVRANVPWVAVGVVSLGALVEIVQAAMALGRSAEWGDLLADALGVAVAMAVVLTPLGRWPHWCEGLAAKARS